MFPVSVAFSAVVWAELEVCSHTTAIIQRDTVLSSFGRVLISFQASLLQS